MTTIAHRRARMLGRDPDEHHRAATSLELLFDLTFVVAFGTAANELAHAVTSDHIGAGIVGFSFATFAVSWAWINFSWFASAFDTDDWIYRLTTMVQMVGVLVLALGLGPMFESLAEGDHVDNLVMVLGYVIMRVAMVGQWARAAQQDPLHRSAAMAYIVAILVAQVGWIALAFVETSIEVMFLLAVPLIVIEMLGPFFAETRRGGTPWHPHHIAERYGLLVIIALGEGMIGTMASLSAIVGPNGPGWSLDFVLIGLSGVALTFGIWWTYFVIPWGVLLDARRERSFGWGYGQIVAFGAVVAIGAGLHAAGYHLEDHSSLGVWGTVVSVAAPVALYVLWLYAGYLHIARSWDGFHVLLVITSFVLVALALGLASAGASVAWCLVVLAAVPWVTVVGYEVRGHRHNARVLEALGVDAAASHP